VSKGITRELVHSLKATLTSAAGISPALQAATRCLAEGTGADQALIVCVQHAAPTASDSASEAPLLGSEISAYSHCSPNQLASSSTKALSSLFTWDGRAAVPSFAGVPVSLPLFIGDSSCEGQHAALAEELRARELCSLAVLPLLVAETLYGWVELRFFSQYQHWHKEEYLLFLHLADLLALQLGAAANPAEAVERSSLQPPQQTIVTAPASEASEVGLERAAERLDQLANLGRMLLMSTDDRLKLKELHGDAERVLGVNLERLSRDSRAWLSLLATRDRRRLLSHARQAAQDHQQLSEELHLQHPELGVQRWISLQARARYDSQQQLLGWEAVLVNITEKRLAEESLRAERQRIKALYDVTKSLESIADPAVVMLKGVRTVMRATSSECGFGCLFDAASGRAELVAAEGLSEFTVEQLAILLNQPSLVRKALLEKKGLLVGNLQAEPLAHPTARLELARKEGLRSVIIAPCLVEDQVQGAIITMRRRAIRHSSADFELAMAAAHQIGLSIRRAELYMAEKRQADSLAALYRLSHELSKQLSPQEIAEHAFPILQAEISCKRLWFGVMNEQGTHIVGQAGYGPGIRKQIIDLQIELDLPHEGLDQALRSKQPVVLEAGRSLQCSGLTRVLEILKPDTMIVVPLVALGQVLGLLVVEPVAATVFFSQRKLPLLTSMAAEIATVLLARRFESRMAEADKMRMAGLLSSGVAHNFNNLLQAIMGQASLLEMQLPHNSATLSSTRMILAAASKGAAMIKQLLQFSEQGAASVQEVSAASLLRESCEVYRSVLGPQIELRMQLEDDVPVVAVDYAQVQQVITNLLLNAREALGARHDGVVRILARRVRLRSGEIDPELPPGSYVRIDIEDNGPGMSSEQSARCFEPFFTTKNTDLSSGLGFGGVGLGLSFAYSILKHHQGLITVSSAPGDGALFSIFLPEARQLPQRQAEQAPAPELAPHRLRVVLADLESSSAFSLQSVLGTLGIRFEVVSSFALLCERSLEEEGESSQQRIVFTDAERLGPVLDQRLAEFQRMNPQSTLVLMVSEVGSTLSEQVPSFCEVVVKPLDLWQVPTLLKRLSSGKGLARRVSQETVSGVVSTPRPGIVKPEVGSAEIVPLAKSIQSVVDLEAGAEAEISPDDKRPI
jgi:signal transduction histidine kinase